MPKGTLQLDEQVLSKLSALAQNMNLTPEDYVTHLVNGLTRVQADDDSLLAECEARYRRFEANRVGVPFSEIADWMNSWWTDDVKPAPICRPL